MILQINETFYWQNWSETMKTKVVDYNDIVSVHNGEEYYHGQITYSDYKSSNGVDLYTEAGQTGGEATHTLTTDEIPAHTHGSGGLRPGRRIRQGRKESI